MQLEPFWHHFSTFSFFHIFEHKIEFFWKKIKLKFLHNLHLEERSFFTIVIFSWFPPRKLDLKFQIFKLKLLITFDVITVDTRVPVFTKNPRPKLLAWYTLIPKVTKKNFHLDTLWSQFFTITNFLDPLKSGDQSVSKCIKVYQSVSKCIRVYQSVSTFSYLQG